ncbi:hypothetical protein [Bradyrhizobium sp. OK095]|uniref:hypothetical protein n=1 Tax=Bradyrhizobium sp. OK095 TaxID=1882760 RepID=UPI0008B095E5|nr:hypothetical protein [Bradyrhizobium sp. OK095]SEN66393.1 hypothetical protein SAMN05443254_1105 [Bradyrhizobium sp. OK095]
MPNDPIPGNDPNEAYDLVHMKVEPHGLPADWWTAQCNGIPVRHFSPVALPDAERYCSDPEYRQSLVKKKLWERGGR